MLVAFACSAVDEPAPIAEGALTDGSSVIRSPGGESAAEARFAEVSVAVVRDSRGGLLWAAHDAGRELTWHQAEKHCRVLAIGAGEIGWRLPSVDELAFLYDESQNRPCGQGICRVDPAIHLSSPYQWTDTSPTTDRRAYFDFRFGTRLAPRIRSTLTRRALCTGRDQ